MGKILRLNESDFKKLVKRIVNEISDHTRNLYISWAKNKSGDYDKAMNYLEDFFKYKERLPKKDFTQYTSVAELEKDINNIKKSLETKSKEDDATKIYDDANVLVVATNTWEAGCKYGAGTKWCTSAKDTSNYWRRHNETGTEFIWINKKLTSDNPNYKLSLHFKFDENKHDWCNAVNQCSEKSPYEGVISLPNYQEVFNKCSEYHTQRTTQMEYSKPEAEKFYTQFKRSIPTENSEIYNIIINQLKEESKKIYIKELIEEILKDMDANLDQLLMDLSLDYQFFDDFGDEDEYEEKLGRYQDNLLDNRDEIMREITTMVEHDFGEKSNNDTIINVHLTFKDVMRNVGRYIYNNYNSPQSQEFRRIFDENSDEAFKNMLSIFGEYSDVLETMKEGFEQGVHDFVSDIINDIIDNYRVN
jgi:hypothetical protein